MSNLKEHVDAMLDFLSLSCKTEREDLVEGLQYAIKDFGLQNFLLGFISARDTAYGVELGELTPSELVVYLEQHLEL